MLLLAALFLTGCPSEGGAEACVENSSSLCYCTPNTTGIQTCRPDGTFSPCECDSDTTSPDDVGSEADYESCLQICETSKVIETSDGACLMGWPAVPYLKDGPTGCAEACTQAFTATFDTPGVHCSEELSAEIACYKTFDWSSVPPPEASCAVRDGANPPLPPPFVSISSCASEEQAFTACYYGPEFSLPTCSNEGEKSNERTGNCSLASSASPSGSSSSPRRGFSSSGSPTSSPPSSCSPSS